MRKKKHRARRKKEVQAIRDRWDEYPALMDIARKANVRAIFGRASTRFLATAVLDGAVKGKLDEGALEALDAKALDELPEELRCQVAHRERGRPRTRRDWAADALLVDLVEEKDHAGLRRRAPSKRQFYIEAQRRLRVAGLIEELPSSADGDTARHRVTRLAKRQAIGPLRLGTGPSHR